MPRPTLLVETNATILGAPCTFLVKGHTPIRIVDTRHAMRHINGL